MWNLRQGDEATYADDSITLLWDSPFDTGCEPIAQYVISYSVKSSGIWSNTTSVTTIKQISGLTPLSVYELKVYAENGIGVGDFESETIELISTALPNAPASIWVNDFGKNYLDLEWSVPTAPGYGSIVYKLEVDEGFGLGF